MMMCTEGNTNRECSFVLGGIGWWGLWVCDFGWMEENKKSGGGDVRAKALSWDPSPPEKSRFAEKKSAPPKKNCG